MVRRLEIFSLKEYDEEEFMNFIKKDEILHVFTICDLKYERDRTQIWIATKNREICGYLLEFDRRIVHTHGTMESIAKLIRYVDLNEPTLVIEPKHLEIIKKFFKPIEPTDETSKGEMTCYLVMKITSHIFKPLIQYKVKRLYVEDLKDVAENLGEEWANRVKNAIDRGIAYGAYEDCKLVSIATASEILDTVALIRGVYTIEPLRGRGLATSVVSALVGEIIGLGKDAMLWVAEDNIPAKRVYEKIGFIKTKHILLGFKAKKL